MDPSDVTATIAPSMDIQVPSNLERFAADPVIEFEAGWSDDARIKETILDVYSNEGYLLDTHTATAWRAGDACRSGRPQLVVATAHPAKFADAVTAAIGVSPDLPPGYPDQALLPERVVTIGNDPSALDPLIR
jgi:threonine synthase